MNIIYPIYKCFANQIFEGQKPFEFRRKLPADLKIGDKVYIYEPAKKGGRKMVVGEFTVGGFFKSDYRLGCVPFLEYFCRHIMKNDDYANKFARAFQVDMPDYKAGTPMMFALDVDSIDYIERTGQWPPLNVYDTNQYELRRETQKVMEKCDDWLMKIGFYNEYEESTYDYAIIVKNPIRYDIPRQLKDFTKKDSSSVKNAPQSFVYVLN